MCQIDVPGAAGIRALGSVWPGSCSVSMRRWGSSCGHSPHRGLAGRWLSGPCRACLAPHTTG